MAGRTKPTLQHIPSDRNLRLEPELPKPAPLVVEPTLVEPKKVSYNNLVPLRSRMGETQMIFIGKSGIRYEWNRGSTVMVEPEDVDVLITKKLHNAPCCGGEQFTQANYLFERVV